MSETVVINPAETHAQLQLVLQRLAEAENDIARLKQRIRMVQEHCNNVDSALSDVEDRLGMPHP